MLVIIIIIIMTMYILQASVHRLVFVNIQPALRVGRSSHELTMHTNERILRIQERPPSPQCCNSDVILTLQVHANVCLWFSVCYKKWGGSSHN